MESINEFYCVQKEVFGNGSEKIISKGTCKVKQELIRPDIFINDYSLFSNIKNGFKFRLSYNPNGNYKVGFSEKELIDLSEIFEFEIKTKKSGYKFAEIIDDKKYTTVELSWCLTNSGKEIVIISSKRWQFDNQPRSAGEDQLGEDIIYIHGIWENPDLPESIINKIKALF